LSFRRRRSPIVDPQKGPPEGHTTHHIVDYEELVQKPFRLRENVQEQFWNQRRDTMIPQISLLTLDLLREVCNGHRLTKKCAFA
jgi:hypothetical protein